MVIYLKKNFEFRISKIEIYNFLINNFNNKWWIIWDGVLVQMCQVQTLNITFNKYGDKVFETINMQGHQILNLPNPNDDFEASTKSYVDTTSYLYLPLIGGTVDGDLIISADTATVRKLGCDNLGVNTGNLQSFMLFLGSNEEIIQAVTNKPTAIFNTKGLMMVCNGNNVVKFGTSLTDSRTNFYQDVLMNSNYITNLHDPSNAQDAATKIMLM